MPKNSTLPRVVREMLKDKSTESIVQRLLEEQKGDPRVLLHFSRGKDSITTWFMAHHLGLKVCPAFYYKVPGLPFEEEDLKRWEKYWGVEILRMPHPGMWNSLYECHYQPLDRAWDLQQQPLYMGGLDNQQRIAKKWWGLDETHHTLDGVRASESIQRRDAITKHGAFVGNLEYKRCHLIWDYKDDDIRTVLKAFQIQLPVDYQWIGRSFDGLKHMYIRPIKDNSPKDWDYLLSLFPLLDLEIARYEVLGGPRDAGTGRIRRFKME